MCCSARGILARRYTAAIIPFASDEGVMLFSVFVSTMISRVGILPEIFSSISAWTSRLGRIAMNPKSMESEWLHLLSGVKKAFEVG